MLVENILTDMNEVHIGTYILHEINIKRPTSTQLVRLYKFVHQIYFV